MVGDMNWRQVNADTRDDVAKSIRGAIFFAVPFIVIVLVVYTIATGEHHR